MLERNALFRKSLLNHFHSTDFTNTLPIGYWATSGTSIISAHVPELSTGKQVMLASGRGRREIC
jgi:hypothetical protein